MYGMLSDVMKNMFMNTKTNHYVHLKLNFHVIYPIFLTISYKKLICFIMCG